jgi:glycosyltransferase involved in cell wall biosynthesis
MNNLRVCFILPKIPIADNGAIVGGSTNCAIGLAMALIRNNVELDIIVPLSDSDDKALQKHPLYRHIIRIPLKSSSRMPSAFHRLIELHRMLASTHQQKNYDIIHIHSGSILYGNVFLGLTSTAVKLHSVYCPIVNYRKHGLIRLFRFLLVNLISTQIDFFIGVTSSVFSSIQSSLFIKKKALKLPMSVDTTTYFHTSQRIRNKDHRSFSNIFRILFVGNTSKEKGLDVLIESMTLLVQKNLRIELFAAIENRSNVLSFEKRRRMITEKIKRNHLEKYIRLFNEIKNMSDLINQVDAVIVPFQDINKVARVSSYPMILLEAMACGKCIVATPLESVREVIKHNYNGILSTSFSAGSLSAAIEYAATSPGKRDAIGSMAMQTIHKKYSACNISTKLKSIYYKLIDMKKG